MSEDWDSEYSSPPTVTLPTQSSFNSAPAASSNDDAWQEETPAANSNSGWQGSQSTNDGGYSGGRGNYRGGRGGGRGRGGYRNEQNGYQNDGNSSCDRWGDRDNSDKPSWGNPDNNDKPNWGNIGKNDEQGGGGFRERRRGRGRGNHFGEHCDRGSEDDQGESSNFGGGGGGFRGGRGRGRGNRGDGGSSDGGWNGSNSENTQNSWGNDNNEGSGGWGGGGGRGRRGGVRGFGYRDNNGGNDDKWGNNDDKWGNNDDNSGRQGVGRGRGRGRGGGGFGWGSDGNDGDSGKNLDADGKPRPEIYNPPEANEKEFDDYIPSGINFEKQADLPCKLTGNNPVKPIQKFEEAGLRDLILQHIRETKYLKPTPVQKYAIPIILADRDLMACAQTGSGKTAAFLVPIIHKLMTGVESASNMETQEPYALIVAPTRELAIQISVEARRFSNDSILKVQVIYGGTGVGHSLSRLERDGCHILVATPGRLLDFLNRGKISLAKLKYLVLDEADRMLDLGFGEDVKKICGHNTISPKESRNTLLFSATFPESVQSIARDYLSDYLFLVVGIVGSANSDVKQTFERLEVREKQYRLVQLLQDEDKTVVFVATKQRADFLASFLCNQKLPTTSIHGDRFQRQREEAIRDFKLGNKKVLVATAVAARGLDIKGVSCVINYDLPSTIDEYVHRIGRTGRVGNPGRATSFYGNKNDNKIAGELVTKLQESGQEVPDWLITEAAGNYGSGYNEETRDIRSFKEQGNSYPAQPLYAVEEEESWE